jgi:hypothetical protein
MFVQLPKSGTIDHISHKIGSQWPPEVSEEQRHELVVQAATYSLAHGLLFLPKSASEGKPKTGKSVRPDQTLGPNSAIHAPISLFPSPFPRKQFELARKLQKAYNVLYARVAMDESFLDAVFSTINADDFIGRLWTIWKDLRNEGIEQVCFCCILFLFAQRACNYLLLLLVVAVLYLKFSRATRTTFADLLQS